MSYVNGSKAIGGKSYSQSKGVKDQIRRRDNHTCQICGRYGHDVDHIVPWHLGHNSLISNFRVLCHSCNCLYGRRPRKDARLPEAEWYDWIRAELRAYA